MIVRTGGKISWTKLMWVILIDVEGQICIAGWIPLRNLGLLLLIHLALPHWLMLL